MLAGCRNEVNAPTTVRAQFLGQSPERGHKLREGPYVGKLPTANKIPVAIVGSGAAGISAAWTLSRAGFDDYLVFDLEDDSGGTARSGAHPSSRYPMAAHYLPAPPPDCPELIDLLEDIGLVTSRDAQGRAQYLASVICAAPTERHYEGGLWRRGLYPGTGQSKAEEAQWERWNEHLAELAAFRDAQGRRGFRLPIEHSSHHFRHLDRLSMAAYLEQRGFDSWRLRWFVDYACRDDYGTPAAFTSAFAGLHHFLCRGFGEEREGFLLTAPEGNSRLLDAMAEKIDLSTRRRLGHLVRSVDTQSGRLVVERIADGEILVFDCERILWAAPRFVLSRIASEDPASKTLDSLHYAPWLVANLELDRAPTGVGAELAWDNIPVDELDLGYVVANHGDSLEQSGPNPARARPRPHVITYYRSMGGAPETLAPQRARLLASGVDIWREEVFTALERMHTDIRKWTQAMHLHRWGHAMIRPEPGLLFGDALAALRRPLGRVHSCATDLSGMALFEEAFYRGRQAAKDALTLLRGGPAQAPDSPAP